MRLTPLVKAVTPAALLIVLAVMIVSQWDKAQAPIVNNEPLKEGEQVVHLEKTPAVNGALPPPSGFPLDIPVEGNITDSLTTTISGYKAKQLSLAYRTTGAVADKYEEYKNYLKNAGYQVQEGASSAPVKAIYGTKTGINISIVISNGGTDTLVQVAYLTYGS